MKNSKLVLTWTAVFLVIGVAMFSLLSLRIRKAEQTDMNVQSQSRYVTTIDSARAETHIERLLNLDDPNDFDPDLTALLKRERERERRMENQNSTNYEQAASVSHDQKGAR